MNIRYYRDIESERCLGELVSSEELCVYGNADYAMVKGFGSVRRNMTFFRCEDGNVRVVCGCFFGTIDEFLAKVKQTHGDSKHAKVYRAAVEVALAQLEDVERRNNYA